ncbi:hypothetical protein Tco_0032394 [Tanacetum coccineum]
MKMSCDNICEINNPKICNKEADLPWARVVVMRFIAVYEGVRGAREAAERAFEAQAEKDRTLMRLEELRFLATSTKDLDDDDAYWIKKQKRLIKNKMRNDLGDEDDEDE